VKALLLLVVAAAATGCSFAARSPEMYRDDTQKVLATKTPEIRACYDEALKKSPDAAGKVMVRFEVAPESGKIQNVTVDKAGTTAPEAVGECVTRAITGLVIDPPDQRLGQAAFVYDFTQAPPPPKS
jgi:hypothetical protein